MAHAKPNASMDATLVTCPKPDDFSPLEAAIMDACNEMHEAREQGDAQGAARVRTLLLKLVDRYDEADAEGHPNAAWARPNQRALALSACGEVERAVEAELIALKYADTPRRREISLGNLADRCIRLGRYEEAVRFFLQARQAAPESVPVMLTGAQALFLLGHADAANNIFATFLDRPEMLAPGTELTAYLDCETRLREMALDLPALRELMVRWNRSRPA
jgi:tetratricopeptide (TPR) repeat protein